MTAVTKVNEIGRGFCKDHNKTITTTFTDGASTVFVNNQKAGAVNLTIGRATCGHNSIATEGSPNVFFENKAAHRINDAGDVDGGHYSVATGSPDVFINVGGGDPPPDPVAPSALAAMVPEAPVKLSVVQQSKYASNVANVEQYNTPLNVYNGVGNHPEVEDEPGVPIVPIAASVVNPNCVGGGDMGQALDNALAEASKGMWKESGNNPNIQSLYGNVGFPGIKGDGTAWCAAFTGSTLKNNCYKFNKSLAAGSYTGYGSPVPGGISSAKKGDIVIFDRVGGTGHVAFYYGPGPMPGTIYVVGGNQHDNITKSLRQVSELKQNGVQRPIPA